METTQGHDPGFKGMLMGVDKVGILQVQVYCSNAWAAVLQLLLSDCWHTCLLRQVTLYHNR